MFVINNARFCFESKKKYSPQTHSEEYKYEIKKDQNEKSDNDIDNE